MNTPSILSRRAIAPGLLSLALAWVAQAQTAPVATPAATSTAPAKADTEVFVLSPFTVATEKDDGFVAASSLAGGRLSTNLSDTPLAYSVLTRDFLDALTLTDVESALAWSVGSYAPPTDTLNYKFFNNEGGSSVMSRGIQTNSPQRNFFLLGTNSDTYDQERIDFARGPNALLIGTSGLGGVVNGMTKQARTDRAFAKVGTTIGSWGRFRATVDVNQPVGEKVAVRVNTLWQEANSWRDMQFDNRRGAQLAATYKPFSHTTVRAEYEYYSQRSLSGLESINDRVSGWDGMSVVAAPVAAITNSDGKGLARNGSSTAAFPVYVPGTDPHTIMNWANTWTTQGGGANVNVPVGGVLPLSATNLGINGGAIIGSVYDLNSLFHLAEAGAAFPVPGRRTVISPSEPTLVYDFQDAAVFVEHQQGKHLFFEAAANYAYTNHSTEYIETRGMADARIDVNQTLPDGSPNPNFKQVYGEGINGHTHFDNRTGEARAAAALVFDDTRWGDFRANLIAGGRDTKSYTSQLSEVIDRNPDIRQRPTSDEFSYRYYWNDPVKPMIIPPSVAYVDPVAGTTANYAVSTIVDIFRPGNQRFSDTKFTYLQGALNARLLKGRLNLIGGARRDTFQVDSLTLNGSAAAVAADYPSNWNGQTIYYRPAAPADYWGLMYVPKNSAGVATGPAQPALTRPRASSGVPLAQYAGDRFQDDYSSPRVKFAVNTVTYGGVLHVFRWLSAYSNYAESFNPPTSGLTLTGRTVPPGLSQGWDLGLRFTLFDGRISASFGKYGSTQLNNSFDSSSSTRKYADITSANVVGDQSANGMNARGLALIPTPTFDFRDRKANGYEIDTVANITKDWRLIFNASWPKVYTTNNASDEWAYLNANEATLKQIVLDAGGLIDSSNVATVNTAIPVANRSPDVTAAVAAWNNIQTFKATNDPKAVTPSNLPDYTANFYTDYRFSHGGFLKGIRVGAGVQYIGRRIIGNRGADTMVDPSNPTRAIDDPTVDATTPVYRPSYYVATGTLSYQRKLHDGHVLDLNFNVGNLLNRGGLIFISTGLRPPNGDVRRPDRITVPTGFLYQQPRSYSLSATLSF